MGQDSKVSTTAVAECDPVINMILLAKSSFNPLSVNPSAMKKVNSSGLLAIITGACFPCLIIVMRE